MEIRTEINEREKRQTEKSNKTKNWLFTKMDKPIARLTEGVKKE